MRIVAPGSTDQLFVDWGSTGATIGVRVDDLEGATTIARTTGFVEAPAGSGMYYLDGFTFPDTAGSYVLIFDDDAGTYAVGHTASEFLTVSSSYPDVIVSGDSYATTDELFRILKIRTPSADQTTAGERVLVAASYEIDQEIDLTAGDSLSGRPLALAQQVCLERAAELWKLQEVQFGIVGLGTEFGTTHIARNTWDKHAYALAPLKANWGLA